ncbi:putative F-box/FBD/LRR-repeat protein At1g78760 isoform X1 [Amaranthus tricolor]|nr:putative F-box/FBD/LRR-repeat protein At1g78760 isoform X1 [Amaranthus tricolor]XP_057547203.1 putative F-box/FBD/LRR-repeat protein At1g78760 isoform X1 [Amaranthus tricolor]XP_057547205.1 putative F-box/FBD/LRR-repeat protein At1g78760 isoform X1 [Amaranthus tricolor]
MSNSSTKLILDGQEQDEWKDKLSTLSDDILVFILSLMERKEATRTCILSRRWRYLATYFTNLNFDVDNLETMTLGCKRQLKPVKDLKPRFLNWVSHVVALNRAPFIDEFRIRFPLDETDSSHLEAWINFAILKRVQNLELHLRSYTITSHVWKGMSHLKSLSLKGVNICGEVVELVFSRCHLLERLYIARSYNLFKLKILNLSSEKLKYLTVHDCQNLEEVEVQARNLVSFDFKCFHTVVVHVSAPSLIEAQFHGLYDTGLLPKFSPIRSLAAHLSKLSLNVYEKWIDEGLIIPSFPNIQYLKLWVSIKYSHFNFILLRCFPEACPLLHEFKLEVTYYPYNGEVDSDSDLDYSDSDDLKDSNLQDVKRWLETREEISATFPNLWKVEWASTFHNDLNKEYMLALHIVKNAIKLKDFIFTPIIPKPYSSYEEYSDYEEAMETCIDRAERLALVLPSHVNFVVIKEG